ncbi:DUF4249 domain-containing protein [Spirosoma pollinicola]|uniref:DUF4249 domain-containing protein n=1 Tax=Spirosoma pollinicola TaxID=2057025 RepID=A0A2K8Z162_9BACT|nr:DUF4249 domain-containing protein [Spirosoma pollinicola]AUD03601.1 DUF4249 domain-containing protein [Spirosoma pollinicola]
MRPFLLLFVLCSCLGLFTCVDPIESTVNSSLNVLIVDGTITDVAETQVIRLNRSQADVLSGRFGYVPVTRAVVQLVIDSVTVVVAEETTDGRYQLPSDFRGQTGHVYQLKFTLLDGAHYESTPEVLQPVAAIGQVRAVFNPTSLTVTERLNNIYTAAHDFYVDFTDPADQANFYRWEWRDWERQEWCRSCNRGLYQIRDAQGNLIEDCVSANLNSSFPNYDYNCRTACWEILYSNNLVLFDDQFSNGNSVKGLLIGRVPLYSKEACLVELRQSSLTKNAHEYLKRLDEQTQATGGVAAGQPALLVGNVQNVAKKNEPVVGYFTVSSVSVVRYWLSRSDASGIAPGLFDALNGHAPINEPATGRDRPPLAVCVSSDTRTPYKPVGWRD